MKFSLVASLLFLSSISFANEQVLFDCKVTRVLNSSIFEESLSVEEYPEVILVKENGSLNLTLGANSYSEDDGDQFAVLATMGGNLSYRIIPNTNAEPIMVSVKKMSLKRKGSVSVEVVDSKNNKSLVRIANLICK